MITENLETIRLTGEIGLPALDNITPVKTPDATHLRSTLSNTLKVLIAFALVERTDTDELSANMSSGGSSRNSVDKNATSLDILKIHSVVQAFFIDTLAEERLVQFWLERATVVWCRSYDEADRRIHQDRKVGLPDDYRRFSIHGKKMLDNLKRLEKKAPELLGHAKREVELRLDHIQDRIEYLSITAQSQIIDGSGEVPPASVFERSSSASETDSAMTPLSQNSASDCTPVAAEPAHSEEYYHSPTSYTAPDQSNPYHWHMP